MSEAKYSTHLSDFSAIITWGGNFQVSNATNSIYSNLFLNVPAITPGIATLTSAPPTIEFVILGGALELCSRQARLIRETNATVWAGVQIQPSTTTGLAPVTVLKAYNVYTDFWNSLTDAFYVESLAKPFSLNVPNAGSYYACTDGTGDSSVYFRLNTTAAPSGCQDILLNIVAS